MKEFIAHEMVFDKTLEYQNTIVLVPFQEKYWNEYQKIYNECFYDMREALEIESYNVYSDYSQIKDKINFIFLYLQQGAMVGAVSCYENELDDLIVKKSLQGKGIGRDLLVWGMHHIKEQRYDEIVLHVAEWNQNAVKLYLKNGFHIRKSLRIAEGRETVLSTDSNE